MAWDDCFTARDYDHYMGYDKPEPEDRCPFCGAGEIETCEEDCPTRAAEAPDGIER